MKGWVFLPGGEDSQGSARDGAGEPAEVESGRGWLGDRWSEVTDAEKSVDVQVVLLLLASPSTVPVT